jgi:nucleoside-diphosphate-sugar epimerase
MIVLVVGGTGFVGSAAGRAFKTLGIEAISASRRSEGPKQFARHLVMDRRNESEVKQALKHIRPDVVLDMACFQPSDMEAVTNHFSGRRYVFVSTHVYPYLDRAPREEDFVPMEGDVIASMKDPLESGETYVLGKKWCETMLERSKDLPWVSMRLPAVFGRYDHTDRITAYMERMNDDGPILIPQESIDMPMVIGWVEDIGRVCATACDLARPIDRRAFNVAYDDVSGRTFIETLARVMGKSPELVPLPLADIPPVARMYGPHPEVPGYVTDQAKSELDFMTSPLEEALEDCVRWFRDEKPKSPFYEERDKELELAKRRP